MKKLRLSTGKITLVDDEDYELLRKYAWDADEKGYARRSANRHNADGKPSGKRRTIRMHRVIMGVSDAGRHIQVDHINGDKLDNRRANLRLCDSTQNKQNSRKYSGEFTSTFKGVSWHKQAKKWRSELRVNRELHFLGLFTDEGEAALAYDSAAKQNFGEFAYLNFPEASNDTT